MSHQKHPVQNPPKIVIGIVELCINKKRESTKSILREGKDMCGKIFVK